MVEECWRPVLEVQHVDQLEELHDVNLARVVLVDAPELRDGVRVIPCRLQHLKKGVKLGKREEGRTISVEHGERGDEALPLAHALAQRLLRPVGLERVVEEGEDDGEQQEDAHKEQHQEKEQRGKPLAAEHLVAALP